MQLLKITIWQASPSYTAQDYELKATPSSRTSTLRRNDLNAPLPKPFATSQSSAPPTLYDPISVKSPNALSSIGSNSSSTTTTTAPSADQFQPSSAHPPPPPPSHHRPEYLSFEQNTLDYRLNKNADTQPNTNSIDYRLRNGLTSATNGALSSSNLRPTTGPDDFRVSAAGTVTDFMSSNGIDFGLENSCNQMSSLLQRTNPGTGTLTKGAGSTSGSSRHSRNHIITDTLPGPESCV